MRVLSMSCNLQRFPAVAGSASRLQRAPSAPRLPARCPKSAVCAASRLDVALESVEARVERWAATSSASTVVRSVQAWLLRLVLATQRLVRWLQLAAWAAAVPIEQQPQLSFASAPGDTGVAAPADPAPPAPAAAAAQQEQAAGNGIQVMGFISAATMGAVEQMRHTLLDASQGIESKLSILERTASSVQGTLFKAAQAHSEAVRSNPQVGMWKQPSVDAVISEEQRLRDSVFAQVYAELLQKDSKSLSFSVDPLT